MQQHLVVIAVAFAALGLTACTETPPPAVENMPESAERFVSVDRVEIHYFDFNPDASGVPILYIHGYSGCGYEAFFVHEDLSDHRIIAPDLPGFGRSEKPDIDYDLSYYLSFVRGFVTALGLDDFVLVGHSLGGKLAAVYAAMNGTTGVLADPAASGGTGRIGRLRALVLMAPYGLDGEAGEIVEFLSNTGSLVDVTFNLYNETLTDVAVRLDVFYDKSKIPEDLINYIASATFYSENGVRALANITRNAIARDPIDWLLPEINVPTLVVWGKDDRVLSFENAATFVSRIAGARLVSVPQCGHMPHIEQTALTTAAIDSFIASVGRAATESGAP